MRNYSSRLLTAFLLILVARVSTASRPVPEATTESPIPVAFTATYALSYNGKAQSKPIARLELMGANRYRYTLIAKGEKGMARMSRAKNEDLGEFLWVDRRPRPLIFQRNNKYIGKSESWLATFDWDTMKVDVKHNKEGFKLELQAHTQDPLSLPFALPHAVAEGNKAFHIPLFSKGKISVKSYRISGRENLQTAIGCLPTIKIERVYTHPDKYQHQWLAPDFGNIIVYSDSNKNGERRVTLKLLELNYAGQAVNKKDRCEPAAE